MTPALLMFALAGGSDANAWFHLRRYWDPTDLPVEWYLYEGTYEAHSREELIDVISSSWQNWPDQAPCTGISAEYNDGEVSDANAGYRQNDLFVFSFDDPLDDLEGSTLAATLCYPTNDPAFSRFSQIYYYSYECDIVYSEEYSWATPEEIDAGACNGSQSMEWVTTHEIGHAWGLGHSCDDPVDDASSNKPLGESCDPPEKADAVMFWASSGNCEPSPVVMTSDDRDGINSLYGPFCTFEATADSERFGGAPIEVCFEASCTEPADSFEWDFGDGTVETGGDSICHTYDSKGQFSVALTATGESDSCGTWESDDRARAYVLACEAPEPAEGFNGLFTYEHQDGLIYQMVNQTDTSVYGCIDQVIWEVYDGQNLVDSISAWSPKIDFSNYSEEEKEYRIVLNVGGPGGQSAGELTFLAEDKRGEATGCEVVSGTAAGFGGLALAFAAAVRRRED